MELHVVHRETRDGITTITLNRPDRLNAWTGRMHAEYRYALAAAEADPAVKVIVVTGAGRGFCAGADVKALEGHLERGGYDDGLPAEVAHPGYGVSDEFDHPLAFHYGVAKPVIAKINGAAAGVGLALACYCDLRFAADDAKLTTAAPKLGLPAEYGLSWVLPRLVGLGHAADLLLSGRVVLGDEAEKMGLVNLAVPAAELDDHVARYAETLATEVSPMSMAEAKRQLYLDQHQGLGAAMQRSAELLERMMQEDDYREGVRSFRGRARPDFKGLPRG